MVDFSFHRIRQHWARNVPAKSTELVLEVSLGLLGDIPDLLFGLEICDEVSGDGHLPTIGQSDRGASGNPSFKTSHGL
jgi:hypothetical protein